MVKSAAIIGGGVIGLCCGIRLIEDGWNVVIHATSLEETSSIKAPAFWLPFLSVTTHDAWKGWCEETFKIFWEQAKLPESGIRIVPLCYLRRPESMRHEKEPPFWASVVRDFRDALPHEIPPGWTSAWIFNTILMDTPIALKWLRNEFLRLGGKFNVGYTVSSFHELAHAGDIIVNCTGVGASRFGDSGVYPVRGQIAIVETPKFSTNMIYVDSEGDAEDLTYIVPREDGVLLGGTKEVLKKDNIPDEPVIQAIIRRSCEIVPSLAKSKVLQTYVGERPGRKAVRLEAERITIDSSSNSASSSSASASRRTLNVIHCYGHGGCGWTPAWGCANEVVRLARNVMMENKNSMLSRM